VLLSSLALGCTSDDVKEEVDAGVHAVSLCAAQASLAEFGRCTPAYEPTFENIFQQTLKPNCATCHYDEKGMNFDQDMATAHRSLLAQEDAERGKVVAVGEPECSALCIRLGSKDQSITMPPRGGQLSEGERCAIVQWIANGAPAPAGR
jgi:hypothetical protein